MPNGNRLNEPVPPAADTKSRPPAPADSPADPASRLRPETLRLMRDLAFTSAVTECPVNLTREEVHALLEMMESRFAMAHGWKLSLQWGLCYARITKRLAETQGFADYARWVERNRIEPMVRMLDELSREEYEPASLNSPLATSH
jgi:hypothetical protein